MNALETGDPLLLPGRHGVTWWPLARDVGGRNGSGAARRSRRGPLHAGDRVPRCDGTLLAVDRSALTEGALRERLATLYGL